MSEVRLPPFKHEELTGVRLLQEHSNWAFKHWKIKGLWEHTTGEGVRVVVLDTGHPEHKDIDVFKSIDFTGEGREDQNGHSTWCCGNIAASEGFLGLAPKCKLYTAKILANNGSGDWSWMKKGLEWALEEHIQIVNISAGGNYSGDKIQPILKELNKRGVLVVCAAGNENAPLIFPANSSDTLAVGAIDKYDKRAAFSNFGPRLIVVSPGVDLLGCWLNNGYSKLSGTSMAAPGAVGILALQDEPLMNLVEVVERLKETSQDIGSPGWDKKTGWGIISPYKFLEIEKPKKQSYGWLWALLLLILFKVPAIASNKIQKIGGK